MLAAGAIRERQVEGRRKPPISPSVHQVSMLANMIVAVSREHVGLP